jgi:hypothetical protein
MRKAGHADLGYGIRLSDEEQHVAFAVRASPSTPPAPNSSPTKSYSITTPPPNQTPAYPHTVAYNDDADE